jgi:hypothetical protein
VIAACEDHERVTFDSVDKAVLFVDTPRPASLKLMPEWLWLADALEGLAQYIRDQGEDPFVGPLVP